MATRQEIQLNFKQAKKEIDKLTDAATDLYKLSGRTFEDTLNGISHCWKGENSTAFINKGNELQRMMTRTAMDLGDILVEMNNIVEKIYKAEMDALEIANKRNY